MRYRLAQAWHGDCCCFPVTPETNQTGSDLTQAVSRPDILVNQSDKNAMRQMQSALSRLFKPAAVRKPADPAYAAFREACAARGITYRIAKDGYIEFSNGLQFAHYGDWSETQARLIEALETL